LNVSGRKRNTNTVPTQDTAPKKKNPPLGVAVSPPWRFWNSGYNLMAANPIKLARQVQILLARPATLVGYNSPSSAHEIRLKPILANA